MFRPTFRLHASTEYFNPQHYQTGLVLHYLTIWRGTEGSVRVIFR